MRPVALALACAAATHAARAADQPKVKDFEPVFSGHGHIRSFMYSQKGPDNWIDTIIGLESELVRYKKTYLVFRFESETDMGVGADPSMIFDPNRGRWLFGLGARTELESHFFEIGLRHDCFHGIDRWLPGQDFKMNSEVFAFGSLGYLQKYRYRRQAEAEAGLVLPLRADYYVAPSIYLPRGSPWQRLPYLARVEANVRLDVMRFSHLGLGLESANVFYLSEADGIQRSHSINVDIFLYGGSSAILLFAGWWPYDDQALRNRRNKTVFGLELSY